MSYKFDSLIIILNKLDSKEAVSVSSLMNDLEISERTVYRYIQTLQIAGFPIVFDRSKGCYKFSDNYCLRKPNISLEETLALALSKKLLKSFGASMEASLCSIESKLSVKETNPLRHIVISSEGAPIANSNYLSDIYDAITNFQRLVIKYKALSYDEETTRKVDPYYLFYHDGFWHMRGYCHLREELRTFALDKILSLEVLNEYFIPPELIPDEEVADSFGAVVDGDKVEVILLFNKQSKPYILRRKWHHSQKHRELEDGRLEMTFTINGIEGIKQWIYRWIPHVIVVKPRELREIILQELKEAMKMNTVQLSKEKLDSLNYSNGLCSSLSLTKKLPQR